MSLSVKVSNGGGGGNFEVPPADNHPAVCVAVIDLGTQTQQKYQSQEMEQVHKVFICWELVDQKMAAIARNFVIGCDYRLSMHEKAKLRKQLESWRGVKFAENEEVDLKSLVGKKCLLSVVHNTNTDGTKTYANVDNVTKLHKDIKCPQGLIKKPVYYEVGEGEIPQEEWLPRVGGVVVKDVIERSAEFRRGKQAAPAAAAPAAPEVEEEAPF